MRHRLVPPAMVLALVAVACSSNAVEVSQACRDAFTAAAQTDGAGQEVLNATLSACGGYDEWLQALHDRPGALGLNPQASIEGQMQVMNFCADASGPVCDDARSQGIIQ